MGLIELSAEILRWGHLKCRFGVCWQEFVDAIHDGKVNGLRVIDVHALLPVEPSGAPLRGVLARRQSDTVQDLSSIRCYKVLSLCKRLTAIDRFLNYAERIRIGDGGCVGSISQSDLHLGRRAHATFASLTTHRFGDSVLADLYCADELCQEMNCAKTRNIGPRRD